MVQFDVKRVQKGTESFMVSFDFTKTPITQIADYIIIAASKHGTSDIHFDPREDGMMVRFRIDGDCQDYTFIPKAYERNLTTRLKLLANMNITESRLPQDGAIKGTFGDTYLDMRVSCLPLNEGEKIVIRILDYTRSLQGIETLGFNPKNLEKLKRMMMVPNGIILTTGATGSGKSTTTYSILQELNKPETNVITVEDPIEMSIQGINQVQVNAEIGMTFAAALRSILRQDPNVILIGEIRDSETAQIAVRAAITGHLVLSTIHTNNSLSTIERLLDMNVERYLLSTALAGIISQRLAKQLCPKCRFQRETTKYEKKVFKQFMHQDVKTIWDANPKGCEDCRNGYHGRIAIHEVLELDDDIRNALNNDKLKKEDLSKMVYTDKTISMLQDALIKALEGKTTFEEVYRVIEIELETTNDEDDDGEDGMNYEEEIKQVVKDTAPKVPEEEEVSDDLLETPVKKEETPLVPLQTNPILEEQKKQKELAEQAALAKQKLEQAVQTAPSTQQANATPVQQQQPTTTVAPKPVAPVIPQINTATTKPITAPVTAVAQAPLVPTTQVPVAQTTTVTKPVTTTAVIPQINTTVAKPVTAPTTAVTQAPLVPKVQLPVAQQTVLPTGQVQQKAIVPTIPVATTPIVPTVPVQDIKPTVPIETKPIVPTVKEVKPGVPIATKPIAPTVPVQDVKKVTPVTTTPITPTVPVQQPLQKLDSTQEEKRIIPVVIPSVRT